MNNSNEQIWDKIHEQDAIQDNLTLLALIAKRGFLPVIHMASILTIEMEARCPDTDEGQCCCVADATACPECGALAKDGHDGTCTCDSDDDDWDTHFEGSECDDCRDDVLCESCTSLLAEIEAYKNMSFDELKKHYHLHE